MQYPWLDLDGKQAGFSKEAKQIPCGLVAIEKTQSQRMEHA